MDTHHGKVYARPWRLVDFIVLLQRSRRKVNSKGGDATSYELAHVQKVLMLADKIIVSNS